MADEPREIKPFEFFDKGRRSELDFRPIENFPEAEVEEVLVDPKDLSAPEPVISSNSVLTIEPNPEPPVSVVKASTQRKANVNGRPTSSVVV